MKEEIDDTLSLEWKQTDRQSFYMSRKRWFW